MSENEREQRSTDDPGARPGAEWDPHRGMPEMLANPRTGTAIALGLGAAALIAGGLWLAARAPEPPRERPPVAAPTQAPQVAATAATPAATPAAAPAAERAAERRQEMRDARDARRKMKPAERREDWKRRVDSFREARKEIQRNPALNREQKREALLDLLRKRFSRDWPVPPPPPDTALPR